MRWQWLLLALPVVIAGVFVWAKGSDDPARAPDAAEPVDIAATGPSYASLEELAAASDLVVVATVTNTSEGRVITDPANPDAGISTGLADLSVDRTLAGTAPDSLVVEYEAALLDGTPIRIGGATPPVTGERVVLFLIPGQGDEFPYYAVIGPQGRYRIVGDGLLTTAADEVSREVADLDLDALAARLSH